MKHCKRCAMPSTRPGSMFDEEGVCLACRNYERRKNIDWSKRYDELKAFCDKYRRDDGSYDCIIPVSGGKDSHFLVHTIKNEMNMNPLLVTVGCPLTMTDAGKHNFRNLSESFNCDHVLYNISTEVFRRVTRIAFEELGEPLKFVESAIYTYPMKLALKYNISLIVYGENSSYEYGTSDKDVCLANDYVENIFKHIDVDYWLSKGFKRSEVNSIIPPTAEEMERVKPEILFMSYFRPWSSTAHLEVAKKYGFKDLAHEWKREGCIEDFEQIDSVGYMVHLWLKYPKFGFQRTSDIASRSVREGLLTLEEAKQLIKERDHKLDRRALDDFMNFLGISPKEFWSIAEKYWNRDLFDNVDGKWVLKDPVYQK